MHAAQGDEARGGGKVESQVSDDDGINMKVKCYVHHDPSVPPWLEERHGVWEVNVGTQPETTINCGVNQAITVDKMYGPLAAEDVRVRLEYLTPADGPHVSDWVIERYNLTTEKWEEKARWDCQESWPPEGSLP